MMSEEIKNELINRYIYIYNNAQNILAPCLKKEILEDTVKTKYVLRISGDLIYFLEEFLLSDTIFNETNLYNMIELNKNNIEYLNSVKEGLILLKEKNSNSQNEEYLDIQKILDIVIKNSIREKDQDIILKILTLDEYLNISNYNNNSKRSVNVENPIEYEVQKKSKSILLGTFANYVSNKVKCSTFSEEEINLIFHKEKSKNIEIVCDIEESIYLGIVENRLYRPNEIRPCKEKFYVKESEIFVRPYEHLFKYYQACPYCGYLVNIPNNSLNDEEKERIEEKCKKDKYLYRKMCLYSELFQLNNNSTEEQKKLIRKQLNRLIK